MLLSQGIARVVHINNGLLMISQKFEGLNPVNSRHDTRAEVLQTRRGHSEQQYPGYEESHGNDYILPKGETETVRGVPLVKFLSLPTTPRQYVCAREYSGRELQSFYLVKH